MQALVLNAVLTRVGFKAARRPSGGSVGPRAQPGGNAGNRGPALGRRGAEGWGHIYGLLATACGYSYPRIDEMTLFDFEELTKYWAEHPPLHIMVAGVSWRWQTAPAGRRGRVLTIQGTLKAPISKEVRAELGPGFRTGDVHAGLTPVVLDFAELRRQASED